MQIPCTKQPRPGFLDWNTCFGAVIGLRLKANSGLGFSRGLGLLGKVKLCIYAIHAAIRSVTFLSEFSVSA